MPRWQAGKTSTSIHTLCVPTANRSTTGCFQRKYFSPEAVSLCRYTPLLPFPGSCGPGGGGGGGVLHFQNFATGVSPPPRVL